MLYSSPGADGADMTDVTATESVPIAPPVNKFAFLELHANLLKAIEAAGYTEPTAVQEQAIPVALAGHDLMVSSQTR